ncbi:alkylhydroperoxidase domain protein [Ketogulonicigenium vulgare]|uniref:alkylhydroperoxidase domain protein n=1 Tax=Ketogulonicigenium vulgare TaxID=92945 RepID=UPI0001E679C1|nr:alkylhydroperoxidase domain protein [Ketogulonicigenium vulgare]ADO42707.1 uncharacterized peroxidase-related enzyme [Ketogulonicigenium vulgare Y25]ALJ81054.1 alkylhydroperoxidase [Ketogulonicigenium vulgare]ANW33809.1 alkylhydroperoxidase domain protein [Ketogulonicigenium vulgare]AOZ54618.1 putative peroxidase-related enzyme [Ketogulonicigenium vulgare]
MTDTIITYPDNVEPVAFTRDELDWLPWLHPVAEDALTDRHYTGLIDRSRAKSPYFRLLAHDPEVLGARTLADKDIFYNAKDGLPRAERELAAAAVSRFNGCIFCASVHARFAATYSKRPADVDQLLDQGVGTAIDPRWDLVIQTATTLTRTPSDLQEVDISSLYEAGLSDLEVVDLIQSAAFFNWANRLMLSLGEPTA